MKTLEFFILKFILRHTIWCEFPLTIPLLSLEGPDNFKSWLQHGVQAAEMWLDAFQVGAMEKWTQRKEQNNYSDHLRELNVVKTSNDINVFTFVLSFIRYSFKNQDFWKLNKVIQGTLKKKKRISGP